MSINIVDLDDVRMDVLVTSRALGAGANAVEVVGEVLVRRPM